MNCNVHSMNLLPEAWIESISKDNPGLEMSLVTVIIAQLVFHSLSVASIPSKNTLVWILTQPWLRILRAYNTKNIILWPPNGKNWLTGKDPDAGKNWRQEEKGMTEDEMFGWHHWLNGREFEHYWELVMDREVWHAAIHEVTKSQTWLSNWTT